MLYGAVEAGGTKFVCAVGTSPSDIRKRTRIETSTPGETVPAMVDFFKPHTDDLTAIGVATFGPVELRRHRIGYGSITTTPKPGWSNTAIVGPLRDAFGLPIGFDTDVNGAALGEGRWGAAQGLDTFVYVTIGTGIGGGAVVGGKVAHGLVHAEMGHVSVKRLPDDDFEGICPFHGDCFEGMACGPAVEARWGTPAHQLDGERRDRALQIEAHYVAEGFRNIVYTVAPERIIVGGGISLMPGIFHAVRERLEASLSGYPGLPEHTGEDFVVPPGLGEASGIAGALALAELAASD